MKNIDKGFNSFAGLLHILMTDSTWISRISVAPSARKWSNVLNISRSSFKYMLQKNYIRRRNLIDVRIEASNSYQPQFADEILESFI